MLSILLYFIILVWAGVFSLSRVLGPAYVQQLSRVLYMVLSAPHRWMVGMNLGGMIGNARTSFCHSSESIKIKLDAGISVSLSDICRSVVPPCRLDPFIFNGHLQTVWTVIKSQNVPIYYRRKIFESENSSYAGTFAVDFVVDPFEETWELLPPRTAWSTDERSEGIAASDDSSPMLIALHGLSGGSHELYLRHVLAPLVSKEGGWKACVINARGCALSRLTSKVMFNARATWDLRQLVKWLHQRFPNRPLFAVGFSLGANILVNYLGEEGSQCILKAAVVCSNPWNLEVASVALHRTWLGREVYSRVMTGNLKALVEIHKDQVVRVPGLSLERVRGARYLHDFDREVQCPSWGYPTARSYYRDASCTDALMAVRIPLFAINAEDDPIAAPEAFPLDEFKRNPYTVLCTTSKGGHLAWFESQGGRWFVKPTAGFLIAMARHYKFVPPSNQLTPRAILDPVTVDGVGNFYPVRRKLSFDGFHALLQVD